MIAMDTDPCMAGNAAGNFRCAVTADVNRLDGSDTSSTMVYRMKGEEVRPCDAARRAVGGRQRRRSDCGNQHM